MEKNGVKFGLSIKLLALISASIFCVGGVFGFMLISEGSESQKITQGILRHANEITLVGQISFTFKSEVQAWKDILIRGADPQSFTKYTQELEEKSKGVQAKAGQLKNSMKTPADIALVDKFLKNEKELFEEYQKAIDLDLKAAAFNPAAADLALKGKDRPVTDALNELTIIFENKMKSAGLESEQGIQNAILWAFGISGGVTLMILLLATFLLRKITGQLSQVANSIEQVSSHIDGAIAEISLASEQLATANTEAAASIEETSASLEEISSMVKKSTEALQQTNQLTTSGNQTAKKGESEMQLLLSSMNDIKGSSSKMEEITAVIDDIAFQTNLLALNASVEAARAGEQGKGFAIVAEAVRGLAQKSAASAKDIGDLIRDSVVKVESGSKIASNNEMILKEIVIAVKKISDLTGEVALMSSEQMNGVEQISKAITQLDNTAQVNAATAEETAGSSMQLREQSRTLQWSMQQLKVVIDG